MMISFDLYRATPAAKEWVGSFLDLDLAKAGFDRSRKDPIGTLHNRGSVDRRAAFLD
jgi:hypothetical protein